MGRYNEDRVDSGIFNDIDPLWAGDFYRFNCKTDIDKYLSEYVLHEFAKKRYTVQDSCIR